MTLLSQHGANRADVRRENTSSRIYGIRNVYGDCVIRDLIEIEVLDDDVVDEMFRMDGSISNASHVAKRTDMVLFFLMNGYVLSSF